MPSLFSPVLGGLEGVRVLSNSPDRSLREELKTKIRGDPHRSPDPPGGRGSLPILSNLLVGNNSENTALISRHSCERYQGPGCPTAPGCREVSAGAGRAFGFVFPPRRPAAAVGVGLRERRRAWTLLSAKFCLLPLLYEHISVKKWRGELVGLQEHPLCIHFRTVPLPSGYTGGRSCGRLDQGGRSG